MRPRRPILAAVCAALALATVPAGAEIIPEWVPDLPVLGPKARAGAGTAAQPLAPVTPTPKVVDGAIADWTGEATGLGGTAVYSHGEYVYTDYVFDDHGPDDGYDVERTPLVEDLERAEPRTYRAEALYQAAGAEFGAPSPPAAKEQYGDARYPSGFAREADLVEVRVAADATGVTILARVSAMPDAPRTALLILADTDGSPAAGVPVPFGSGLTTELGDTAVLVTPSGAQIAGLRGGGTQSLAAAGGAHAYGPAGFTNAIEVRIPRSALGAPGAETVSLAVGAGVAGSGVALADIAGDGANLFNTAFRFDEPVRVWMDRRQAFALHAGTVDGMLAPVDLSRLTGGATEVFEPRPGYYERVFESDTPGLTVESGTQGRFQHYGLYIPSSYRPGRPSPATVWLHWRGGKAHSAGAFTPGVIRQLGERRGNIIVSPSARGTSTWYLGRGHADFLEVYDDALGSFSIDRSRVYVSGYSMGGFGSYLLGTLYPDRFAAAFPIVGPPSCGAWIGAGDPVGASECASPGFSAAENAKRLLTYKLIENTINLPYVIFAGTSDELVPISGVTRQAARFDELGHRSRFYAFPGYEHYTFAVVDEWVEGARYLDRFTLDPAPARVVYKADPAMEHAVETIQTNGIPFDFSFDGAYWVDGMRPADASAPALADATTLGRGAESPFIAPDAGVAAPGHSTPFVMTGLQWLSGETSAPENAFTLRGSNLGAVTLRIAEMGLSPAARMDATISTDEPLTLRLEGSWEQQPLVESPEGGLIVAYAPGALTIAMPAGARTIRISP